MKKLYWICLISGIVCAVLGSIAAVIELNVLSTILMLGTLIFINFTLIIYLGFVKFKCPKCKTIFKARWYEVFFAPHTPTTRKITCPFCRERLWCEDIFEKDFKKK